MREAMAIRRTRKALRLEPLPCLHARTAKDLMTLNPISLHATATTQEAADFFYKRGFSAAPVIDDSGNAVGVLTLSDLVWFQRAKDGHFQNGEKTAAKGRATKKKAVLRTVQEIMTPAVFSVQPDTPARQVLEEMCASNIHHLFVVDSAGALVGVISALDVVRHLLD